MINKFTLTFMFSKFKSTFNMKRSVEMFSTSTLIFPAIIKIQNLVNGMHATQNNFTPNLFKNIIHLPSNCNRISFQVWHFYTLNNSLNLFVTECFTILTCCNFDNASLNKLSSRTWQKEDVESKLLW